MTIGARTDFTRPPHPNPLSAAERERLLATPSFGRVFSDHMVTILHDEKRGWHDPHIEPRAAPRRGLPPRDRLTSGSGSGPERTRSPVLWWSGN